MKITKVKIEDETMIFMVNYLYDKKETINKNYMTITMLNEILVQLSKQNILQWLVTTNNTRFVYNYENKQSRLFCNIIADVGLDNGTAVNYFSRLIKFYCSQSSLMINYLNNLKCKLVNRIRSKNLLLIMYKNESTKLDYIIGKNIWKYLQYNKVY
jgi:hypothetical protein